MPNIKIPTIPELIISIAVVAQVMQQANAQYKDLAFLCPKFFDDTQNSHSPTNMPTSSPTTNYSTSHPTPKPTQSPTYEGQSPSGVCWVKQNSFISMLVIVPVLVLLYMRHRHLEQQKAINEQQNKKLLFQEHDNSNNQNTLKLSLINENVTGSSTKPKKSYLTLLGESMLSALRCNNNAGTEEPKNNNTSSQPADTRIDLNV